MQANLNKSTVEFKMFADYWAYVKKYYIPEDSEEYWTSLLNEGVALTQKYEGFNEKYIRDLVLAYVSDVERRYQTQK